VAALVLAVAASEWDATLRPGVYEIVVQTTMPHLEENLRYATVRERRCLQGDGLASLFPVLSHDSLAGCALERAGRHEEAIRYHLVCQRPDVASGSAWLRLSPGRIEGVLQVKMGGKNMTFEQRIRAMRQGECP
jgi:hypothetical protein